MIKGKEGSIESSVAPPAEHSGFDSRSLGSAEETTEHSINTYSRTRPSTQDKEHRTGVTDQGNTSHWIPLQIHITLKEQPIFRFDFLDIPEDLAGKWVVL